MTSASLNDAYQRFLSSSNIAVWIESLEEFRDEFRDRTVADEEGVWSAVRGLLIAIYVNWLGSLQGGSTEQAGKEDLKRLSEIILAAHSNAETQASSAGVATIAAWRGYHETARRLFPDASVLGAPFGILNKPSDPAKTAAFLRPYALDQSDGYFSPSFYFYCDVLLEVGNAREVNKLIEQQRADDTDPMIADLKGRMLESAGDWLRAADAYRRPKEGAWKQHEYKASICEVIAGGASGADAEDRLIVDDQMVRWITRLEVDISQAELARIGSFVNACRWNKFDNWIVQFEMGKLCFRRRRYWAADTYFQLAGAACPESARFAVADMRFSNLTWISSQRASQALPMRPEALLQGYRTLDVATPANAERSASIGGWIAGACKDLDLLDAVFESDDLLAKGDAYSDINNKPKALINYLECIESGYQPRAMHALIESFSQCGFVDSADFLISTIRDESRSDVSLIWELGRRLLNLESARTEVTTMLAEHSRGIGQSLVDLSRNDFQHLIRVYEYFVGANRREKAMQMLDRASKLAEGSEENLSMAIARRTILGPSASMRDLGGLTFLRRAEREAVDRLERLEIARECFNYGEVRRGRKILKNAGVLRFAGDLDHGEYIVVLQCATWLSAEERKALVVDAAEALERDIASYRLKPCEGEFVARFLRFVPDELVGLSEVEALRNRESSTDRETAEMDKESAESRPVDDWPAWLEAWQASCSQTEPGEELKLLGLQVDHACESGLGWQLALWPTLFEQLSSAISIATKVRPSTVDRRTPFRKNRTIASDWRAQEISDLWRKVISAGEGGAKQGLLEDIREFYSEEEKLLSAWNDSRREDAQPALERVRFLADLAQPVLRALTKQETAAGTLPVTGSLLAAIRSDAQRHLDRIEKQLELLQGGGKASDHVELKVAG